MRLLLPLMTSFMSYSGVLKSTISQNAISIFEKNAPLAVYQTGAYLERGALNHLIVSVAHGQGRIQGVG